VRAPVCIMETVHTNVQEKYNAWPAHFEMGAMRRPLKGAYCKPASISVIAQL
jgi:hypothetical protein